MGKREKVWQVGMGRFFWIGGLTTLIDYLLYAVLVFFGFSYILGIVVGYFVGLLVNFYLTRKYVFQNGSKFETIKKEFGAVFFIAIIAVGLNILIVKILAPIIDYYSARVVAIILVFFVNFYLRKWFVYL